MRRWLYLTASLLVGGFGFVGSAAIAEADGAAQIQLSAAAATSSTAGMPVASEPQFVFPGLEHLTLTGRQTTGADIVRFGNFRAGTTTEVGPDHPGLSSNGLIGVGGAVVGAFAEYRFDAFKFTANARQDASANHGSSSFAVGFGYGAKLASDVSLAVGPSATWSNGRGQSEGPLGLVTGGRNAGGSGLALHDVGASVSLNWQFQDRWQLSGVAGARQVLGASAFDAESEQGSATQLFTGVTLGYRF